MDGTGVEGRAAAAAEIAREAGAMALAYFQTRGALTVEAKANAQDMFSEADREVETLIRARIAARFPDDGVLGEEHGHARGRSGFLWVVDPIDGTQPFLSGMRHWCVAIAVLRGGETVAGAIFQPSSGELFAATLGGGAFLDGTRLRLDPALTLANGLTGVGASHRAPFPLVGRFVTKLMEGGGMFFRHGSGALMLASVACGRLAAYWEPHMHPWDCLAGLLMVREAGGWTLAYPGPGGIEAGGPVAAAGPGAAEGLTRLMAKVTT